ncbi:hypothetical protein AAEX28_15535 [Lentisphaerota bacterium WC36G]|nr:hypothetical protein LJT99_02290 [Lentisphaerae bacterium WC36]
MKNLHKNIICGATIFLAGVFILAKFYSQKRLQVDKKSLSIRDIKRNENRNLDKIYYDANQENMKRLKKYYFLLPQKDFFVAYVQLPYDFIEGRSTLGRSSKITLYKKFLNNHQEAWRRCYDFICRNDFMSNAISAERHTQGVLFLKHKKPLILLSDYYINKYTEIDNDDYLIKQRRKFPEYSDIPNNQEWLFYDKKFQYLSKKGKPSSTKDDEFGIVYDTIKCESKKYNRIRIFRKSINYEENHKIYWHNHYSSMWFPVNIYVEKINNNLVIHDEDNKKTLVTIYSIIMKSKYPITR